MYDINCNGYGQKGRCAGNSEFPNQTNLKEDTEAFINMKQSKSSNKHPGGGDQKALVYIKDTLFSLVMRDPTKEWGEPPYHGLVFCKTTTQDFLKTEPIKNKI